MCLSLVAPWPVLLPLVSIAYSNYKYFFLPGGDLKTWMQRGTIRVKWLDQQHFTINQTRVLTNRPLALESSTLTIREALLTVFGIWDIKVHVKKNNEMSLFRLDKMLVSWFYMPLVNVSPSINLICSWQLSGPRKPPTFSNINFCLLCDMKLVFLRQQFGKYHLEWEELLFDEVLFAPTGV